MTADGRQDFGIGLPKSCHWGSAAFARKADTTSLRLFDDQTLRFCYASWDASSRICLPCSVMPQSKAACFECNPQATITAPTSWAMIAHTFAPHPSHVVKLLFKPDHYFFRAEFRIAVILE
jgi:hypothetical protein